MQLPFDKKYLIFAGIPLVIIILVVVIVLATRKGPQPTPENPKPNGINSTDEPVDPNQQADVNIWGVFDDNFVWQPIVKEFNRAYPNIKIIYSKKDIKDYERNLVDAIASGTGPDIFTIQHQWLPKHKAKIEPANTQFWSPEEFQQKFIDVAYQDFVDDGKIFAVPTYTDNLALFYNRKIFRSNEIYEAPQTWNDILDYSKTMTRKVSGSPTEIAQSGIAMGTVGNINRASDILLALMFQNGTPIISGDKRNFTFNQFQKDINGNSEYPGTKALEFFSAFSDPSKSAYTWNEDMGNSLVAFSQGKVAMMLGYSYMVPTIQKASPSLDFAIAPLPQPQGAAENITLADYWGYTISKNSKVKNASWQFLKFISENEQNRAYLEGTKKASAIKNQYGYSDRVFDNQKNNAKTFYKGNAEEFDAIITELINDTVKFNQSPQNSIDTAARKANDMLSRYQ